MKAGTDPRLRNKITKNTCFRDSSRKQPFGQNQKIGSTGERKRKNVIAEIKDDLSCWIKTHRCGFRNKCVFLGTRK